MKQTFLAGVAVENSIYFSNWLSNGLYRLDIETGRCELVTLFVEEANVSGLHNYAFLYKDKICFVPCFAEKIAFFDIKNKQVQYRNLPVEGKLILDSKEYQTFRFVCFNEDNTPICWMVPVGYNLLIKLNMETTEFEIIKKWPLELKWEDGIINFHCGCVINDVIHLMPYESMYKVEIDIVKDSIKSYELCKDISKYRMVIPYKNDLICVPEQITDGVKIYSHNGILRKRIEVTGLIDEITRYVTYGVWQDVLILFPFLGREEIHIDLKTFEVSLFPIQNGVKKEIGFIQRCLEIKGDLYLISDRVNGILKIGKNGKRDVIEIIADEKQYYDVWVDVYDKQPEAVSFINDGKDRWREAAFDLRHFIKYIRKNKKDVEGQMEESAGLKILKELNG